MVEVTGAVINFANGITNNIAQLPEAEIAIFGVATILLISAIFAYIAKMLKQPLIPAYVLAGLITGPLFLGLIRSHELIYAFLEIGIAFLLFAAGLEISFKKIKEANLKKILFIGLLQVVLIFGITYLTKGWFGLSSVQAVYMGIILAFSSTMVDIKLLSDIGELVTLHGRLVLGVLLLQDLVAIIAIALLTSGELSMMPVIYTLLKLGGIVLVAFLLQKFVLGKVFKFAANSPELLFICSLGVLFLFIILSYVSGISIAIGAFIAGISLANSPFKSELESRISPIKDFFSILFFVALGMQIVFTGIDQHIGLLIYLILGAVLLKPVITYLLLRVGGYQPRTSSQTSISLAQLSEFSLIIGIAGVSMGALSNELLSTVILATVITMSVTPYFIEKKDSIYKVLTRLSKGKPLFPVRENIEYDDENPKEILLIGAHRMGAVLLGELMKKNKKKLIVMDHNPEIIHALTNKKVACLYGDITSPEILDKINLGKIKLVISTIPDYDANLHLLRSVKAENPKAEVILTGSRISETIDLYEAGADYVITPKVISGEKVLAIMHSSKKILKKEKRKHMKYLDTIHKVLY